jgi:predicted dithiol-disulfide oxidoreductase (DUF899 family)
MRMSCKNDFDYDFGVSLPAHREPDSANYNFETPWGLAEKHAGISAFALRDGVVYHTYWCYARGLEAFTNSNCSTPFPMAAPRRG